MNAVQNSRVKIPDIARDKLYLVPHRCQGLFSKVELVKNAHLISAAE